MQTVRPEDMHYESEVFRRLRMRTRDITWKILLARIGDLICTVGELGAGVVKEIGNRKSKIVSPA